MLKTEIIILSNNIVLPFQNLRKTHGLNFIDLNKLFVTRFLSEHGLGFLIKIYEFDENNINSPPKLIAKFIFDTGSTNLTFLHNLDIRGEVLYDLNGIVLSHWHYDHTGAFYEILERVGEHIPVYYHDDAIFERFFRRSGDVLDSDLLDKTREDILPLLKNSRLINQEPIDLMKVENLNGKVKSIKTTTKIFDTSQLKVHVSGEITRYHEIEDFSNFYSLQDGIIKTDKIMDDKCMIFEYDDTAVILNGCCHSGIMNTIDHVKKVINKPISHIIGGFHMASASKDRIKTTIDYINGFQEYEDPLYLFPIHCSGEKFMETLKITANRRRIQAYNVSVGTTFFL